MIIKVTIVDDTFDDMNKIKKEFEKVREIEYQCTCYSDSTDELIYKENSDLYILDIDMPNRNGFDCAHKLTALNPNATFIFYSCHDDLMFDSYKLNSLFFIRKGQFYSDFQYAIEKVNAYFLKNNLKYRYSYNNIIQFIDYKDILYFESNHNNLYIYLSDGKQLIERKSMKDLSIDIPPFFIRVHSSFFVNFDYLKVYQLNRLILTNGKIIPISRNRQNEVKVSYEKYKITR